MSKMHGHAKAKKMTEIQRLLKEYLDYLEVEKNRSIKTQEAYERYLKKFIVQTSVARPAEITDLLPRYILT